MGVHDGHRERLKGRFLEHGLDNFNDLNTLELLLFYAIPRKDTNVIAHGLMDKFGTLDAVFDASVSQLMEVQGIGENAALLIKLVPQVMKKCEMARVEDQQHFRSSREIARYLMPRFMLERDEVMMMVCFDAAKRILAVEIINRGVVNAMDVSVRRIAEAALKHKTSSVVLAHNHPDGVAVPSIEDERFTVAAQDALKVLGIKLLDHLIIVKDRWVSVYDMPMFGRYR